MTFCCSLCISESAKSIPDLSGKMCLPNSAEQPIHPLHISLGMVNESEYPFSASWIISFRSTYNLHLIIHLSDSQGFFPVNSWWWPQIHSKKVIMLSLLIKRMTKRKIIGSSWYSISCLSLMTFIWCSKIPHVFPLKGFQICLS